MAGTTLGTAYVQIVPSAQGISGSISNVLQGEASSAGTGLGTKIAGFAKKALVAAGIGTAIIKGVKAAIDEGSKLQQSYIGGLDTLYGEAAEAAREHAREASKYGITMNDYSEQAVSFGAALKAAYGGDTTKAMEAANTAIMDMADNSAKMGTDISSIQTAYQGFAKQNYTMLDNLKLGYGGTKQEMERLLEDAEKLSGQTYSIDNLGDVYDAIHVIQQDLGLTGVAAEEASETFSGSFAAMKASASNFFGSLALGENVEPALTSLMESANTWFFNNFVPMLGTIIGQLPTIIATFVEKGIPTLLTQMIAFIKGLADKLKLKADSLTGEKVKNWIVQTIPKLIKGAGEMIGKFAGALIENLPKIIRSIGKIGLEIVKGLGMAIWPKVKAAAKGVKDKFLEPIENLKTKVKAIIDKIKGFFDFTAKTPHVKLPHFTVTPAGWKLADLLEGKLPKLGISWYAKGGIATSPNLIGIGEKGPEAILPLNPFWNKMDRIVSAVENGSGGVTINVYASPGMDVNQLAGVIEQKIIKSQKQRRQAWASI